MATTMTLAVLRSRLSTRVGGLTEDLTSDEIDDYIVYAHKFLIPNKVDGYLIDAEWSQSTVVGQVDYDIGADAHSIYPPVRVDGDAVATFTRLDHWNADHDPDGTDTGIPDRVLIFGTKSATTNEVGFSRPAIRVYPIPDATTYTLSSGGRAYPSIELDTSDGETLLTDWVLVNAILAGAAREFALDHNDDELAKRESMRFDEHISMLNQRSMTPAQERMYMRTF